MTGGRAIIVGAGHAGAQLCASLRKEGWTGEILVIGDEPALPYNRPPLSKTGLAGTTTLDDLLIRPADYYAKNDITFHYGLVTAIDRQAHSVTLRDGAKISYDKLALCLGARPRQLPIAGADLSGVHYLRNVADIEIIRAGLADTYRVVIIGAGYIGLEAAASLHQLGIEVTVLESSERVLQRVTAPAVSAFYARVHREAGVEIRTGVSISEIQGDDHVSGARLADDDVIAADLVIVGIGILPNTELARDADLAVNNGIVIDDQGRTSDPDIVAAGDCASHFIPRYGRVLRLESVPSAVEQAKVAAAAMCDKSKMITALPWFWSDQYDLKLQIAGLSEGYDSVVLRGDPDTARSFACFYFAQGQLIAADCVNRPQEFMFSKRVIGGRTPVDPNELANPDRTLSDLLKAALTRTA